MDLGRSQAVLPTEFVSTKNLLHLQLSLVGLHALDCVLLWSVLLTLRGVYLNGTTVKGILAMLVVWKCLRERVQQEQTRPRGSGKASELLGKWPFRHRGFPGVGVPPNGSFVVENHTKMDDDWGHFYFRKPPHF